MDLIIETVNVVSHSGIMVIHLRKRWKYLSLFFYFNVLYIKMKLLRFWRISLTGYSFLRAWWNHQFTSQWHSHRPTTQSLQNKEPHFNTYDPFISRLKRTYDRLEYNNNNKKFPPPPPPLNIYRHFYVFPLYIHTCISLRQLLVTHAMVQWWRWLLFCCFVQSLFFLTTPSATDTYFSTPSLCSRIIITHI